MMSNFPMRPARLSREERETDVDEMLTLARREVAPQGGWLLAEAPRAVVFTPWDGTMGEQLKREFSSMTIFGPQAEVRMEKTPDALRGRMRVVRSDPEGEELFLARRQSALLRDKGRLLYDEYFREDEDSGFLFKALGRLCGVEDK